MLWTYMAVIWRMGEGMVVSLPSSSKGKGFGVAAKSSPKTRKSITISVWGVLPQEYGYAMVLHASDMQDGRGCDGVVAILFQRQGLWGCGKVQPKDPKSTTIFFPSSLLHFVPAAPITKSYNKNREHHVPLGACIVMTNIVIEKQSYHHCTHHRSHLHHCHHHHVHGVRHEDHPDFPWKARQVHGHRCIHWECVLH